MQVSHPTARAIFPPLWSFSASPSFPPLSAYAAWPPPFPPPTTFRDMLLLMLPHDSGPSECWTACVTVANLHHANWSAALNPLVPCAQYVKASRTPPGTGLTYTGIAVCGGQVQVFSVESRIGGSGSISCALPCGGRRIVYGLLSGAGKCLCG